MGKASKEVLRAGFLTRGAKAIQENEALIEALYNQIGRQKVVVDFLKKSTATTPEQKRLLIDRQHTELALRRQCELLGLAAKACTTVLQARLGTISSLYANRPAVH